MPLQVLEVAGERELAAAQVEPPGARAEVAAQREREREREAGRLRGGDPVGGGRRERERRDRPLHLRREHLGEPGEPRELAREEQARHGPLAAARAPGAERRAQLAHERDEGAPERLGGARIGGLRRERGRQRRPAGLGRDERGALGLGDPELARERPREVRGAERERPGRLAGAARDDRDARPLVADVDDRVRRREGGGRAAADRRGAAAPARRARRPRRRSPASAPAAASAA